MGEGISLTADEIQQRRAAFRDAVPPILDALGLPRDPLRTPGWRQSNRFTFTGNEHTVVVSGGAQEGRETDLALAYGLGLARRDQELVLVLPGEHAGATSRRAAWLRQPLRLFTHNGINPVSTPVPDQAAVLAVHDDDLVTREHSLGDLEPLVSELLSWISQQQAVVTAHRFSYRSWHFGGRQVLRLIRSKRHLEIVAGVDHRNPGVDQRSPVSLRIDRPLSPEELDRIVEAVGHAIDDRRVNTDSSNDEHRLQEALSVACLADLPLARHGREFPAFRFRGGSKTRSFIDFLGPDPNGGLQVIESKIGPDEMLVLQGLDYYIWALAHRRDLEALFGATEGAPILIDYVVGRQSADGPLVHPFTMAQARALSADVRVRFWEVSGWRDGELHVRSVDIASDAGAG